jgi:hypothetical protein
VGLLLVIVAAVCLFALWTWMQRSGDVSNWSFRRKDYLLTQAERSFFEVLCLACGTDVYVFSKVRLADLVWLPGGIDHRRALLNRVIAKHIDFVLCERRTLRPVLAIELNDRSHETASRASRDAVVRRVLETAGLPLRSVPAARSYVLNEIRELIRESRLRPDAAGATPQSVAPSPAATT